MKSYLEQVGSEGCRQYFTSQRSRDNVLFGILQMQAQPWRMIRMRDTEIINGHRNAAPTCVPTPCTHIQCHSNIKWLRGVWFDVLRETPIQDWSLLIQEERLKLKEMGSWRPSSQKRKIGMEKRCDAGIFLWRDGR